MMEERSRSCVPPILSILSPLGLDRRIERVFPVETTRAFYNGGIEFVHYQCQYLRNDHKEVSKEHTMIRTSQDQNTVVTLETIDLVQEVTSESVGD